MTRIGIASMLLASTCLLGALGCGDDATAPVATTLRALCDGRRVELAASLAVRTASSGLPVSVGDTARARLSFRPVAGAGQAPADCPVAGDVWLVMPPPMGTWRTDTIQGSFYIYAPDDQRFVIFMLDAPTATPAVMIGALPLDDETGFWEFIDRRTLAYTSGEMLYGSLAGFR